jgi:hypothetical protein
MTKSRDRKTKYFHHAVFGNERMKNFFLYKFEKKEWWVNTKVVGRLAVITEGLTMTKMENDWYVPLDVVLNKRGVLSNEDAKKLRDYWQTTIKPVLAKEQAEYEAQFVGIPLEQRHALA